MPVFNIVLKEEARLDIAETVFHYDGKQESGLSDRFLTEMEAALDKIAAHPFRYGFYQKTELRSCPLHSFRFTILYDVEEMDIIVYSVRHTPRDTFSL